MRSLLSLVRYALHCSRSLRFAPLRSLTRARGGWISRFTFLSVLSHCASIVMLVRCVRLPSLAGSTRRRFVEFSPVVFAICAVAAFRTRRQIWKLAVYARKPQRTSAQSFIFSCSYQVTSSIIFARLLLAYFSFSVVKHASHREEISNNKRKKNHNWGKNFLKKKRKKMH